MLVSLVFILMLAVPLVLLVADIVRGRRDAAPPAPAYGEQIARRGT